MGYTKLFSEIVMSTVWQLDDKTRILWITMLAIKDRWHRVNASIPGLADASRMTIAECEAGLEKLMSPDPYSRSKECEGRRIQEIDGGWVILNGEKYRERMSLDDRREYNRIKQKQYYHEKKPVHLPVQSSTNPTTFFTDCRHTDSDSDTSVTTNVVTRPKNQDGKLYALFDQFWNQYPKKMGKDAAKACWKRLKPTDEMVSLIMASLETHKKSSKWEEGFIPAPAKWLSEGRWQDEVKLAWRYDDQRPNDDVDGDPF